MPQIERWDNLPEGVRQHLIERMRRVGSQSAPRLDRDAASGSRQSDPDGLLNRGVR
jgi:hypothetical protein